MVIIIKEINADKYADNREVLCTVCVFVYHIFVNQSSVDGHLDCFHVLAVVNSAAMNTGMHVIFPN